MLQLLIELGELLINAENFLVAVISMVIVPMQATALGRAVSEVKHPLALFLLRCGQGLQRQVSRRDHDDMFDKIIILNYIKHCRIR